MYWEDTEQGAGYKAPGDVVELVFRLGCSSLPLDHAYALRVVLERALPWFATEPRATAYIAYGAESSNGWVRPEGDGAVIQLSRRARLNLRLPRQHVERAMRLVGSTLDIDGHSCVIRESKVRPLSAHATLFSRHLAPAAGEEAFLNNAAGMLAELGVRPPKMMSGLSRVIRTPRHAIETRSLMIDGLKPWESVLVQQRGLGEHRKLGCGIFLPHKSIHSVYPKPKE